MPSYVPIRRWMDSTEKMRTAERLLALRQKLKSEIVDRAGRSSLLVATWNIRDFDANRLGHGPRLRESFYYIAEIIAAFDLVVLQEVSRNLEALEAVLSILGPGWDYIATDTIESGTGTEERMAFIFRQSKVTYRKISGEMVLPGGHYVASRSGMTDPRHSGELVFSRAPFIAAFQAGGFRFNLCTLHLRYEGLRAADLERHMAQLDMLGRFVRERREREREDYILLGDFGVGAPSDLMAKVLERHGFAVPEVLTKRRAQLDAEHYYDQMAFPIAENRLEFVGGGAFRPFDAVFRDNDEDAGAYHELMPEEKANDLWNGGPRDYYVKQWRTWQISDHLPLWAELKVDFTDHYLETIRKAAVQL
jgi:endonuclease/exonuclease/phosphatase family metal-dependent hydrolase